jgi:hypothetical protein
VSIAWCAPGCPTESLRPPQGEIHSAVCCSEQHHTESRPPEVQCQQAKLPGDKDWFIRGSYPQKDHSTLFLLCRLCRHQMVQEATWPLEETWEFDVPHWWWKLCSELGHLCCVRGHAKRLLPDRVRKATPGRSCEDRGGKDHRNLSQAAEE